ALRAGESAREVRADVEHLRRTLLEREQRVERRDAVRLGGRNVEPTGGVPERARRDPADAPLRRTQRREQELSTMAVAPRDAVPSVRLDADYSVDHGALGVSRRRLEKLEVRQRAPV